MRGFWAWYERHYVFNLALATFLFALQLIHLYWLTTHVLALRLFGHSWFTPTPFWQYAIVIVDYAEIPALLSTSILYAFELSRRFSWRSVWFLVALNLQWLHLFWITDEFIISQWMGIPEHRAILLPAWLAWVALVIDYLELPVIIDTFSRLFTALATGRMTTFVKEGAKFHMWKR